MRSAMRERGDWIALELVKARARRLGSQQGAVGVGVVIGVLTVLVGQVVFRVLFGLFWEYGLGGFFGLEG